MSSFGKPVRNFSRTVIARPSLHINTAPGALLALIAEEAGKVVVWSGDGGKVSWAKCRIAMDSKKNMRNSNLYLQSLHRHATPNKHMHLSTSNKHRRAASSASSTACVHGSHPGPALVTFPTQLFFANAHVHSID